MSGNTARRAAITAATNYKHAGVPLDYKESPAASLFGTNVFGLATMKSQLPKEIFQLGEEDHRHRNAARSAASPTWSPPR